MSLNRFGTHTKNSGRRQLRLRAMGLATLALTSGVSLLVACSSERDLFVGTIDQSDASEASSPTADTGPTEPVDAGADADADATKPDFDAADEPVTCEGTPCVKQLSAGDAQFCALMSDGTVQCWGRDSRGSLGRGDGTVVDGPATPAPVVGLTDVKQVSVSTHASAVCAVTTDGKVQCWGDNYNGQLALPSDPSGSDRDTHATPTQAAVPVDVTRVDLGEWMTCAIGVDKKTYCWGYNYLGFLARPTAVNLYYGAPEVAALGDDVVQVAADSRSAFALTADGRVLNWATISGRESTLQSYDGTPVAGPIQLAGKASKLAVSSWSSGSPHYCVISEGDVYCWGDNPYGSLGTGIPTGERLPGKIGVIPEKPVPYSYPQQLALAPLRSCVRMTDGKVQCCGDDRLGQLGRGADAGATSPVFTPATEFTGHAVQIAASTDTTCALLVNGKVQCWGGNANGELGQGTQDTDPHPTPVTVAFQ